MTRIRDRLPHQDAHDLVTNLRRYWEWSRLLPKDASKFTVDLVRSRPGAIEDAGHEKRLWRRLSPPTGRESSFSLAFVFADTAVAKVGNPDGHALCRAQEALADAEDERRRAAQRSGRRSARCASTAGGSSGFRTAGRKTDRAAHRRRPPEPARPHTLERRFSE